MDKLIVGLLIFVVVSSVVMLAKTACFSSAPESIPCKCAKCKCEVVK